MSDSVSIIMFTIFSIHLVVFAGVYYRHPKKHHLFFVLVFFLLVLSYGLRLWGPQLNLFGNPVYNHFRYAAWIATAVALFFWVQQKRKR